MCPASSDYEGAALPCAINQFAKEEKGWAGEVVRAFVFDQVKVSRRGGESYTERREGGREGGSSRAYA